MPVRFRPPVPVRVGVAQLDESAGFRSPRPLVRFQPLTPDFEFRGLGKRINPLGLGPRESRFKSEVPDQFLWGSQVVRQLAVNQLMRRFESCPHSQECRGRLLVEGPSPTKRCSRVRSSTPVPNELGACGRGDSGIALLKRYTLVRVQPGVPRRGRSMEGRRSLKPSTLVRFQPSAPRFVLAWCTVHRRIYKPLRSRLEHGLGSTPSASTMRSKLIRMSSRFLIGRQLVRFQPDAPNSGTVAEW